MANVIDSSAILAIVLNETGAASAERLAEGGMVSTVTVAEVVTKCVELNLPEEEALDAIRTLDIEIVFFDETQAMAAGRLRRKAPKGVLSLGDRACLALALARGASVVTGDRVWAALDIGCDVRLFR